jgi:hypothetical protein
MASLDGTSRRFAQVTAAGIFVPKMQSLQPAKPESRPKNKEIGGFARSSWQSQFEHR